MQKCFLSLLVLSRIPYDLNDPKTNSCILVMNFFVQHCIDSHRSLSTFSAGLSDRKLGTVCWIVDI